MLGAGLRQAAAGGEGDRPYLLARQAKTRRVVFGSGATKTPACWRVFREIARLESFKGHGHCPHVGWF